MKATEKKQQLDNKGFTLVEILVAVTILTLVVTPLLSAFVTSARVNAMAKTKHQATVVAENVFEGIKNFGIEEAKSECQSFNASTFKIIAGSVGDGKVISQSVDSTTGAKNYEFLLSQVEVDDINFDIQIKIKQNISKTDAADASEAAASDAQLASFGLRKKSYYDVVVTVYKSSDTATSVAQFTGSLLDYA
jgi:prepilin-type N-terminal cleavage/methylation domain-containing protein